MCNLVKEKESSAIFETCEHEMVISDFKSRGYKTISSVFSSVEGKCNWQLEIDQNHSDLNSKVIIRLYAPNTPSSYFVKFKLQLLNSNDILITEGSMRHIHGPSGYKSGEFEIPRRTVLAFIEPENTLKIRVNILAELLTTELPKLDTVSIQEKKETPPKLLQQLESMFKNATFSDFVIVTSDGSKIKVHRNILAARSPVFAKMLAHNASEKNVGCVEIRDTEKETMLRLLNFLYTEKVETLLEDEAQKLLIAAEKYQVIDLKDHCSEDLASLINDKNLSNILLLAHLYNVPELKRTAIEYYSKNAGKFSRMDFLEIKAYPDLLVELLLERPKSAP